MNAVNTYCNLVLSGEIVTGNLVKQACQRHLNDLKRKDFEYYFDEAEAERWFQLFEMLNLWKGEWSGQTFRLELWQKFIIGSIVGWKSKQTGLRRFKKAYTEMARKNAKTTLMAGLAIGFMAIDGEEGAQIITAATKEEQARIVVNDTAKILQVSPMVNPADQEYFKIYELRNEAHRILTPITNSYMKALGRDSKSQDGLDIHLGIIDEYHAHETNSLLDVIESGMAARKQPLLAIITTAGFNLLSPCYEFRRSCEKILSGEMVDENLFAIIYSLDEGDDWQDESNWIKSNPNLDVSVKREFLKSQMIDAINRPTKQVAFLTKNMNMWVDAPTVWIPDSVWTGQGLDLKIEDLAGFDCYGGLDLASTSDTTALVFYFPNVNGKQIIFPFFFIPKETAKEKEYETKVPYRQWAKQGWLTMTDGNMGKRTDYSYIRKQIHDLVSAGWWIHSIGFDRWNSDQLIGELRNDGFVVEPHSQGIAAMSYPTKDFEKRLIGGNLHHNNSPVLRWQIKNVVLTSDANENVKIAKDKSFQKVDGAVACVMALARYLEVKSTEESYFIA
jgi:phage terminase large subunit-like protein